MYALLHARISADNEQRQHVVRWLIWSESEIETKQSSIHNAVFKGKAKRITGNKMHEKNFWFQFLFLLFLFILLSLTNRRDCCLVKKNLIPSHAVFCLTRANHSATHFSPLTLAHPVNATACNFALFLTLMMMMIIIIACSYIQFFISCTHFSFASSLYILFSCVFFTFS